MFNKSVLNSNILPAHKALRMAYLRRKIANRVFEYEDIFADDDGVIVYSLNKPFDLTICEDDMLVDQIFDVRSDARLGQCFWFKLDGVQFVINNTPSARDGYRVARAMARLASQGFEISSLLNKRGVGGTIAWCDYVGVQNSLDSVFLFCKKHDLDPFAELPMGVK